MSDVLWRRLRYMLTPQWDIYNSIAEQLPADSGLVADIGCGTGIGTLRLARKVKWVNGFDIDMEAITFARNVLTQRNLGYMAIDLLDMTPAVLHDAVTMIEVLEHISDWQAALKRVGDLLRPGGKLYISARNANADLRRNDLHEREWTAAEFRAALAGYFSDVKLYDYTLVNEQTDDSHVTPLVAVCVK